MSAAVPFDTGDAVRVLDGPFRGFVGVVMSYDADAERLMAAVPVFGRQTLVPLDRWWVEKVR
jgi:transcriptional antiterminator NusG